MSLPFWRQSAALPLLLMGFASSAGLTVAAQDQPVLSHPKVLVISREYTKPGKDGSTHQATEGVFVKAFAQYKATDHYIAEVSLTGPSRTLFLYGYPNFAAWEEARKSIAGNQALSSALDQANSADGDLLSLTDASVWIQRDDLSLNPGYRTGARMEEISQFRIRPGHASEWEELVKLVLDGYRKGVPEAHFSTYEEAYGSPGGGFIVLSTKQSGQEIDTDFASDKKFTDAMGPDGMKKLEQLESSCVESRQTNLFLIDPKMSYPPEDAVRAEPGFWKTTTAP